MTIKCKGEAYRNTVVCVDSYERGVPIGRFYNQYLPEGKAFRGVTQFLVEMEKGLDEMDYPQAFMNLRMFTPPAENLVDPPQVESRKGVEGTFVVRILFRQNASWQGSVTWLEGKQEQSFRSALELILMMDGALSYEKVS